MTDWRPATSASDNSFVDEQGMIRVSRLPTTVYAVLLDTLADVTILMSFLIEASDGRLQSQFDDTRGKLAKVTDKVAQPPCDKYEDFLARLLMIQLALPNNSAEEANSAKLKFDDLSFLYWTRDFLSTVAAPATADSIAITRQYVDERATFTLRRFLSRLFSSAGTATTAGEKRKLVQRTTAEKRVSVALWLSSMLRVREYGALFVTLFVIALSTYSISGQLILRARQAVIDNAKDINQRIESVEKDLYALMPRETREVDGPNGAKIAVPAPQFVPLCDLVFRTEQKRDSDGGKQAGVLAPTLRSFVSIGQINLCAERQRNLNEGIAVAAQMLSWLHWIDLLRWAHIPQVFGDDPEIAAKLGTDPSVCNLVRRDAVFPNTATNGIPARDACSEFADILEYYGKVPDAVLQCLTLYLLPSLYGALGAVIATIRYVRGRVSICILTYIDRGRVSQDWILGVVLGAVIGLFADYLAKATPVEGIALSAIALMAGYNVTAVFGLFENISGKLFGTGDDMSRGSAPMSGKPVGG